jgi:hypothetical protein
LGTDPTRVYVTGHSMGGHGTWQFGVLFPGRFAVVGPSAGWASFYSYVGWPRPSGAFARSMASSDTQRYVSNLARRSVYVIHGSADDTVPVTESRNMVALLAPIVPALTYHEEPGAGHWWDGDRAPGVDCVDWVPLFETMQAARLDPTELEFDFVSPSPSVSAKHSYVTIRSASDPMADVRVVSTRGAEEGQLVVTTTNVRSLVLDGDALMARGMTRLTIDGAPVGVRPGEIPIGPQDGKRPEVYGPFDQVLSRPWCFVYADDAAPILRDYAAFLTSSWQVLGNGSACALPASEVDAALRASRNLVWIGAWPGTGWAGTIPFTWNAADRTVSVGTRSFTHSVIVFVFPWGDGTRLGGAIAATPGDEMMLFRFMPFTSHLVAPDYMVFGNAGISAAGFLTPEWSLP